MQGQIFINEVQGNFFLRTPKENKPSLLYYVICYGGKKYRFATGMKVYPNHWDMERQKAYISFRLSELDNNNNIIVNEKIEEYERNLSEFKAYLCNNPNEIMDSERLLKSYIYKNQHTPMNENCIDYLENCIMAVSGLSDGTRKDYLSTIKNLKVHCDNGNEIKSFNDINKKYVKKYYEYLRSIDDRPTTTDGKLSLGYINKQISQLWNVLNKFAVENEKMDYTVLAEWKDRSGWIVTDKSKKNHKGIALRDDEVLLLWDYWYKIDSQVDKDILATFLLECLTGQRFSDIEKITENLDTVNSITTISLVQKKGGKEINCGIIFELAKEILAEYKNNMPIGYTNDFFNKRLKAMAKKAGITGKKLDTRHSGTD
ncbi:phage integrase SAM-like domain-containing protein, partial [Bacteroides sp. OttesenSCG-928-N06]|nr:phage integrase SAM-like domain-containing protein [Bacteroides sp. OttesenSCG-928-N06]